MNIKQISLVTAVLALILSRTTNAVLGPIPIYLNTEYRTDTPVIGSISSTLIFDEEDIATTGANTFLDFLSTVPSVVLFNAQGNVPAIYMRGSDSHHTLVLVDGVRMNPANSGKGAIEYGLTSISLNDIEKIEIVKGSGSVLYGSSAIAGVIAITTKKGADGKRTKVSTKFGSHNSKTYALSTSNGDKDGYVRFTYNKYTTDGINTRTDDTTGEKDGISNSTTQIKAGNERFDVSYLESRNKTEYDNAGAPDQLGDRKFNKIAINVNNKFSDTWKAKLSIAQTKNNRNTGAGASTIGDRHKSNTISILNDIKIDNALLNIGFSHIEDKNATKNQKLTSENLFVNWQKNINNIDINAGARYINHSKFGNETVYNLGAAKYLNNGIKLTGSYATAFNAPSLPYLLDYWGGENPNLKPETSTSTEIGIEKNYDWGLSAITLFKTKTRNAIGGWPLVNQDTYLAKGVDISTNANIAGYGINFGHTYAKSRANNASTQAVKRPKNITNIEFSKQYGKFNSKAQVINKSSSLISNGEEVNGYTLLNMSTGFNINDNAKMSLSIKNATDKDYKISGGAGYRYIQPGRTFTVGLDYSF
ncbi:MAG: TonB-dependent receptor [Gammaproteobacteria bacterium]|jgi:vitamin B12 transporter|nr:TonB-dependent receptor [Gammaproteobacteria bacterium]|tara:strand:+ start:4653 stop:6422 length:1770 start_codon:yes stop_codon:yes gene_type:complete